jgi:hypothetical protein
MKTSKTSSRLLALFLGSVACASANFTLVEVGGTFVAGQTNLAFAATPFASTLINGDGYGVHAIADINDGVYGNSSSWIGEEGIALEWVGLTFSSPITVSAIAFGRDNTGTFEDRHREIHTFQYSTDNGGIWQSVGHFDYFSSAAPTLWLRHLYNLNTPVSGVTDVRMVAFGGMAYDELEVYASPIPEPSSAALLAGLGMLGLAANRRRHRKS